MQEAVGIDDSPEAMYDYYAMVNQWRIDPLVVRALCEDSASAVRWLTDLGVHFDVSSLVRTGMGRVRRGHRAEGGGAAIAACLERACHSRDIDIAVASPVDRLLVEGGRVVGVRAREEDLRAGAVVVGLRRLRAEQGPAQPSLPEGPPVEPVVDVGGGGRIDRGGAGARRAGRRGICRLRPRLAGTEPERPREWCATGPVHDLRRSAGRRFLAEDAYHSLLAAAIEDRGGTCYALFDRGWLQQARPTPPGPPSIPVRR